ncbi:MAG: metallophosphoesterase family protein [Chloroherpetonaceae bacterium]|nr:metallophosphoesterase family protein [Chthonomonadaceae bacterium]MDW8207234.1 metallophosphoesterase family protein [Chloroherpetonaceae bacterium]
MQRHWRTTLFLGVTLALVPFLLHHRNARSSPQQTATPRESISEAEVHRPTPIPDRIILTWQDDPAHTQSVTWRTDTSVKEAMAQIAAATPDGNKQGSNVRHVVAETTPFTSDLGNAHYHTAHFTGLEPETLYAYRVGDGVHWSEWFHFRTASDRPKPFRFIYLGDAQNSIKSLWSRVIRRACTAVPDARFIIHAGDLVNRANRDAEWGEWFQGGGWANAMIPSIAVPGNHEYENRRISRHWQTQFAQPKNGVPGLEESSFYLDYQGVRIIGLNSNEKQVEQKAWLETVLQNNPNRWTIVTFHHPIFSSARGRDNAELRRLWKPLFDAYRVDLVLQGHDHTYARSHLNGGATSLESPNGTVYIVSVGGPKMYNLEREPWMRRVAEDTQLYQVIQVDGDRLRYEAYTATGELYDAFELRKRADGPNRLIDRVPRRVPERLRPPGAERTG